MSIKGLTDEIVPRLPRLGKLRKGGEKTAKGFGDDLDHFRFTSDNAAIVAAFTEALGETPRALRVYIPYQTLDLAFPNWCEVWDKTGLVHRCDGQTMSIWRDGDKYQRGAKPCAGGHEKNEPRNDAVGRLDVIIPELIQAGHVGYVSLETHSLHDILNISRVLKGIYDMHHDLRGIEFILRRSQEEISTPGFGDRAGQRSKVKKWLVRIEPAADWMQLQIATARAAAMQLPAPTVIDGATGEIVERPALPAPTSSLPPDEEKYFGKPPAEAPAAKSTLKLPAKPKGIGAEMWANITKVANEAIALGLTPTAISPNIKAKELAEWGTTVKAAIAAARKGAAPAKGPNGTAPTGPKLTRDQLLQRLAQLREWADFLGVQYKPLEGNVGYDDLVSRDQMLKGALLTTAKAMLDDIGDTLPNTDETILKAVKLLKDHKAKQGVN